MIVRVCCACHIILGYLRVNPGQRTLSHGYCPRCMDAVMATLVRW